jgi:signal transduction histidine kinase
VVGELVLLAVSTPALIAGLALAGARHGQVLFMAYAWSIVQLALMAVIVVSHMRDWAPGATDLGRRAAVAEAAVRREEERLHELRSTVNGIGMTRRLLREREAELPPPARSRLEGLYESELSRLERLLDDQPAADEAEVVDVASLVDEMVESARLRGTPVSWRRESAYASGRPSEIVEIVRNLLDNAARHARGAEVAVVVATTGDAVRVEVSDDGPGIPDRVRPRLFERGARRDGSPGHGLGLHIARRLAREMGGDLRLEASRTGRGTTFTLLLPQARTSSAEDAACLATAE